MKSVLGIIGGSGLYDLAGLCDAKIIAITSPWGEPSSPPVRGRIGNTDIVFIARHGIGHKIPPSDINYRANIDCLKRAGVTDLVSVSACGSLREDLPPGNFVLVDQFFDRTYRRENSFFGRGCVAHVSMAEPVSPKLVERVERAAIACKYPVHKGGTYLAMEGPQYSSRAESAFYRTIGADVIGMTAMPEAKLAREAEMSYALLAMVTDYDCWHPGHLQVDAAMVVRVMHDNAQNAQNLIVKLAEEFPAEHELCPIGSDRALDQAIVTSAGARDPVLLRKLDAVAGRVLG